METRNLGLIRALGWERTSHGVEFRCVTELLAPARVAVEAAGPRALRVRITAGASPLPKAQTYVVARPDADAGRVETSEGRVTVRTSHLVVEASLDPWQLTFRAGQPAQVSGSLAPGGTDRYILRATRGAYLEIRLTGVPGRSVLVRLLDAGSGKPVDARADAGTRVWTGRVAADGNYRIEVVRQPDSGKEPLIYTMSVAIK